MRIVVLLSLVWFCASAWSTRALAQYDYSSNQEMADRLDRLEHDLQLMQKQVSRGEPVGDSDISAPVAGPNAQINAQQADESIRRLQGEIEKLQHQNDELKIQLERMAKDTDYRLKTLEDKSAAAVVPATPVAAVSPAAAPQAAAVPATPSTKPVAEKEKPTATPVGARDQYNAAFQLLNQAKYEQASNAFEAFVQEYPKDPLTANAFYWLGETYYVRGNYAKASDSFRQGFEANPKGSKAADNLLKLGMSLSASKRDADACVVFRQIGVKYSNTTASRKASQEATRLACQ